MPKERVNGVELHYEMTGSGTETVVFLNGIAMSVSHWKPVVDILGRDYRCLCHDMRGQTLSEKPSGEYSLEQHAADLAALMDALSIAEGHIVGTSYGAEVALAFAAAYPKKCSSLIVIDGVSELDPLLEAVVESWMAAAACDPRVFYKTILPWNYSAGYIKANREILAARENSLASLPKEWFEGFVSLCKAFLKINLTPELNRIHCPSRILVGEYDILKHRGFARIIAENIKDSRLDVIPGAGHAAVIEQPDTISREIALFISGLKP